MKPKEFIPTRVSLLNRLKDWNDSGSWREFFEIYRKLLFNFALKAGLSEMEAEEIVQETVISVAKTIKEFEYDPGRCSFKSWLRHLAQKRIADRYRKRSREPLVSSPTDLTGETRAIERVADGNAANLDALWEEEWQAELFAAAVASVKKQVSAEQYQIFDFYVLKKMPVGQVAKVLGTNAGQVYLVKHRVSKLLKKEIDRLKDEMGDH